MAFDISLNIDLVTLISIFLKNFLISKRVLLLAYSNMMIELLAPSKL